jgi:ATP-dependent DNA ligase
MSPTVVLDGELVVPVSELSFDHLLMRLRRFRGARKLSMEHPAIMLVFDILSDESGLLLTGGPLSHRSSKLEQFGDEYLDDKGTIRLSPATRDIEVARKWLALAGGSLDGVVAKRLDQQYQPGPSRGMQKIKRIRAVDCVVGGVIYGAGGIAVSHVLVGLYDDGLLHFVGSAPLMLADGKRLAGMIAELIEPPGFTGRLPGQVRAQFGHRIGEWHPIVPSLVAEVQYCRV